MRRGMGTFRSGVVGLRGRYVNRRTGGDVRVAGAVNGDVSCAVGTETEWRCASRRSGHARIEPMSLRSSQEALQSLGVHDGLLSAAEKAFLDEQGYLPRGKILSDDDVARVRQRLDELATAEGEAAGQELHQEAGTKRLANLLEKDAVFEQFVVSPRVLAGVTHVIGRSIQLSSLSSRSALPGQGQQEIHADWADPVPTGDFLVCNAAWMIDDFSAENGGTRIIPGSQRRDTRPRESLADVMADQPDQINVSGSAGSVVVFNSHTWHGGALNRSATERRVVLSYFTVRHSEYIQNDHRQLLSDATKRRMSREALVLAAALEDQD